MSTGRTPARPPRGRRPAGVDTRADIVAAARTAFAEAGYQATSMRHIARRAGVDPALVHHYFEGKAALFAEIVQIRVDPSVVVQAIVDGDRDGVGERAVRSFFEVWDSAEQRPMFAALLRSALADEHSARTLREFLAQEVFGRIVLQMRPAGASAARALSAAEAQRAGLAAAQMSGMALMRYVIALPALADAPAEELIPPLARTMQRYLVNDAKQEYISSHDE